MENNSPYIGVDSPAYEWSAMTGTPLDFSGGEDSNYTYLDQPDFGAVEFFGGGGGNLVYGGGVRICLEY